MAITQGTVAEYRAKAKETSSARLKAALEASAKKCANRRAKKILTLLARIHGGCGTFFGQCKCVREFHRVPSSITETCGFFKNYFFLFVTLVTPVPDCLLHLATIIRWRTP
jgi:hypothetical protein